MIHSATAHGMHDYCYVKSFRWFRLHWLTSQKDWNDLLD